MPTFALWFQVAVDWRGRGFDLHPTPNVHGVPADWRREGSDRSQGGVPKAHVGRWGDLPPQGRLVT